MSAPLLKVQGRGEKSRPRLGVPVALAQDKMTVFFFPSVRPSVELFIDRDVSQNIFVGVSLSPLPLARSPFRAKVAVSSARVRSNVCRQTSLFNSPPPILLLRPFANH